VTGNEKSSLWVILGIIGGVVLLFCAAGVVVAFIIGERTEEAYSETQTQTARVDARAMQAAARMYAMDNPGACPTVDDLVAGGFVDPSRDMTDPWGSPFRIECGPEGPRVASDGPDGEPGGGDDVVAE